MEKEDIELSKVKKENTNSFIYILGGVIALLLVFIGYLYTSYDMVQKGKIESMKKEKKVQNITFESLPISIKENYILVNTHKNEIAVGANEIKNLEEKLQVCNQDLAIASKPKVEEEVVSIDKIVEKIVTEEKVVEKVMEKTKGKIDRSSFETFGCYEMLNSGYHPSKECINRLKSFLDEHREDTRLFEIIGVVDDRDFTLLTRLKDVYKEANVKRLEEFAQYGLARKRVIEATWVVVDHLRNGNNVSAVNYTVTSKKGLKGFVVRAYK